MPSMKDQTSRQLKEFFTSFFALKPFDYPRDLGVESLKKETFMKSICGKAAFLKIIQNAIINICLH